MAKVRISYSGQLEYPECPKAGGEFDQTKAILCNHPDREWVFCKHHHDRDLTRGGKFGCPMDPVES